VRREYQRTGDCVTLAGVSSPGFAELDRFNAPLSYDERQGYGLSGAWLFFKGEQLSKGTLKIKVYPGGKGFENYPTIFDFIESPIWKAFHDVYRKPPTGTRPRAMLLIHPLTAELGIGPVVTLDESIWRQTGDGEWSKEISLCSYRKPKKRLTGGFTEADAPIPQTDTQRQIAESLARLAAERASH